MIKTALKNIQIPHTSEKNNNTVDAELSLDAKQTVNLEKNDEKTSKDQQVKKEFKAYLMVSIPQKKQYFGKQVKVYCGNQLIWGMELESGIPGFNLEYRNIPVESTELKTYRIVPDIPGTVFKFTKNRTYTDEQLEYNKKYGIIAENRLYYSMLGNTVNPERILVTFPGFGKSTARVCYAISAMSFLSEETLDKTLILAFQDNYFSIGNYMMYDDLDRSLSDKIYNKIKTIMNKHKLSDEQLIMFGASKGGTIAINNFDRFQNATLITSVPQINLNYYFKSKTFFRNSLFHKYKKMLTNDTENLIKKYVNESRNVHYFYTDNDELSNYGFIETLEGRKYRIDGDHGQVTNKVLTSFESIINDVPMERTNFKYQIEQLLDMHGKLKLKIYVPFIRTELTKFDLYVRINNKYNKLEELAAGTFITNTNQELEKTIVTSEDSIDVDLVALAANGRKYVSAIPEIENLLQTSKAIQNCKVDELKESITHLYTVTNEYKASVVEFIPCSIDTFNSTKKILIVDSIENIDPERFTIYIKSNLFENFENLCVFIDRLIKHYHPKDICFHTVNSYRFSVIDYINKSFVFDQFENSQFDSNEVLEVCQHIIEKGKYTVVEVDSYEHFVLKKLIEKSKTV